MDGIRNGSPLRKKDNGDRAYSQGPRNRDRIICHRWQCLGHYASECTAPAPTPRSGSRKPQKDEDRGPRGTSSDGSRGHPRTGATGGPGIETGDQHHTGQGSPAQAARIGTATITFYTLMKTARRMRRRIIRPFRVFPSKTWLPRQMRKPTTTACKKIVIMSATDMTAATGALW